MLVGKKSPQTRCGESVGKMWGNFVGNFSPWHNFSPQIFPHVFPRLSPQRVCGDFSPDCGEKFSPQIFPFFCFYGENFLGKNIPTKFCGEIVGKICGEDLWGKFSPHFPQKSVTLFMCFLCQDIYVREWRSGKKFKTWVLGKNIPTRVINSCGENEGKTWGKPGENIDMYFLILKPKLWGNFVGIFPHSCGEKVSPHYPHVDAVGESFPTLSPQNFFLCSLAYFCC